MMIRNTGPVALTTVSGIRPRGPLAEHCQVLVRRLFLSGDRRMAPVTSLGLTSCGRGQGVSTLAVNLAVQAAACVGERVLLIDANAARPVLHRMFGVRPVPGLNDLLANPGEPDAFVYSTQVENLWLLPAGSGGGLGAAIAPTALVGLLENLRRDFGLLIFDLPAADERTSCFSWGAALDGVVLVVEAERVDGKLAERTRRKLAEAEVRLMGVVLNKQPQHLPRWLARSQ